MSSIQELTEGVYFSKSPLEHKENEIEGIKYYRFMNHFYINTDTQLLTEEQVFSICSAREANPEIIGEFNIDVRDEVKSFIINNNFKNVLEIGCGRNPAFSEDEHNIRYTASDANPDVIAFLKEKKLKCIQFGNTTDNDLQEDTFDLAFALFVLHFHVSDFEIINIGKHIKPNGVFIANVYRINDEKRNELKKRFEEQKLSVSRVDSRKACKSNEYWVICHKESESSFYANKLVEQLC
jgi:SAM-dependent methyltransferase